MGESIRYYRGGVQGIPVGGLIVPGHSRDNRHPGCPICEARARGEGHALDPLTERHDRVYITSDREYARFYASQYGLGDLYQVVPVGNLERSAEDVFPCWTAQAALVLAVYARRVHLTDGGRRRLYRRWAALEGVDPRDADREWAQMLARIAVGGVEAVGG